MAGGTDDEIPEAPLNLRAIMGFNGKVPGGLVYHPDGKHVIFPLGTTVVIKDVVANTQAFLQGHTDIVTSVALSRDGRFVASGQATSLGLRAPVLVWDFAAAVRNANTSDTTGELLHELVLHKGRVDAIDFSAGGKYLASLGGPDDNSIVVWDLESGEPICGTKAASHHAHAIKWFNNSETELVSAGQFSVRRWELDLTRRRLIPEDMNMGPIRREVDCIAIDDDDRLFWCGTRSGDVLEVSLRTNRFTRASRNRFPQGVRSAAFVPASALGGPHDVVVLGAGNGAVVRLSTAHLEVDTAAECEGAVTSIALAPDRSCFFAGTTAGNRYLVDTRRFDPTLRATSHPDPINALCFPRGTDALFLTCSKGNVRLWDAEERTELLRIQVPNLQCLCVTVSPRGDSILTGWDDGKVRAFGPESGKLQWVIPDAHSEAVTALAVTNSGRALVTGGRDGRVRLWELDTGAHKMQLSFKEHKKEVTAIVVSRDDTECVSSSADGSCVVWNLRRGTRANALFASTVFKSVSYYPDEAQLITVGTDRKIGYWDTADCTPIRMLEASTKALTGLDLSEDGSVVVTGGADRSVKVWLYDEGVPIANGKGHSGTITDVRIAPGGKFAVSTGEEGAIFIWDMPAPEAVMEASAAVEAALGTGESKEDGAAEGGGGE